MKETHDVYSQQRPCTKHAPERLAGLAEGASPVLSVVVCTYNRAGLLATVLQTLCTQTADRSDYEVIVVDNNSSDATRQVVQRFQRDCVGVHYRFEPRQGLSHARNRGWQEARGRYVAYIDDDCRVPNSWVALAKNVIDRIGPAAFGGPYSAWYNAPKPRWFRDAYGSHVQGDVARELAWWEFLDGSNIMIRRTLLERLNGFRAGLGMVGTTLGYGEETELLRRIRAIVPRETIHYEPTLQVEHLVGAEKMSLWWMAKQRFIGGRSTYHVFGPDPNCRDGGWAVCSRAGRVLGALALDCIRAAFRVERTRYPHMQNYFCERVLPHLQNLGRIHEQCCRRAGRPQHQAPGAAPPAAPPATVPWTELTPKRTGPQTRGEAKRPKATSSAGFHAMSPG